MSTENINNAIDRMEHNIDRSIDKMETNINDAIKNMEENIDGAVNRMEENIDKALENSGCTVLSPDYPPNLQGDFNTSFQAIGVFPNGNKRSIDNPLRVEHKMRFFQNGLFVQRVRIIDPNIQPINSGTSFEEHPAIGVWSKNFDANLKFIGWICTFTQNENNVSKHSFILQIQVTKIDNSNNVLQYQQLGYQPSTPENMERTEVQKMAIGNGYRV